MAQNLHCQSTVMNYIPLDKEIFTLAASIVESHGREAIRQAAIHAYECETGEDIVGSQTWDLVMHAILELNRRSRRDGELCN